MVDKLLQLFCIINEERSIPKTQTPNALDDNKFQMAIETTIRYGGNNNFLINVLNYFRGHIERLAFIRYFYQVCYGTGMLGVL